MAPALSPHSSVVYIGVGSNVGNRAAQIKKAYAYLINNPHIKLVKKSSLYITAPIGPRQRDFINAAVKIRTRLSPRELLKTLHGIEKKLGKKTSTVRWGPRAIDLDILLYGKAVVTERDLVVPHREMKNRRFVLEPLLEIAPRLVHPVYKLTLKKILVPLRQQQRCRKFKSIG